ncbi:MAG: protease modulator HflC [Candidatus Aegiribacteria sp.]|nr:protease modulator HflC [Candidatus Aegiribacteria sp.]
MRRLKHLLYGIAALFILMVVLGAFFTVSETEQAVILQLGNPVRVIVGNRTSEEIAELQEWIDENAPGVALSQGAGLYLKIPFLQQVKIFDDRILEYDDPPADVVTKDKKHLNVDCYARWRIQNPLLFLRRVRTENGALSRLDDLIYSMIRQELGKSNLIQIVRSTNEPIGLGDYVRLVNNVTYSDSLEDIEIDEEGEIRETIKLVRMIPSQGRIAILRRVTSTCRSMAEDYGIYIVDVRIKRADLPEENQAAVFTRMQAERNRISNRYRAEGRRMSDVIIANTDLQVDSIRAEANRTALTIRGIADSTAAATYAEAYNSYPDFYSFVRSLETLEAVMGNSGSIIVGTDGIFEYLVSNPGEFL